MTTNPRIFTCGQIAAIGLLVLAASACRRVLLPLTRIDFAPRVWLSGALLLVLGAAPAAEASVINGGFETGAFAPGWSFTGGAGVASAAFGTAPASGSFHALMENGPSAQTSIAGLETFLGVPSGALGAVVVGNPPGHTLMEGSAIRQTGVVVLPGESISFAFNFLTDESGVSDTAFWTLSSSAFFLADEPTAPLGLSFTRFFQETGYSTVSSGPLPGGTYTIGFGVADYGVTTVDSGLLIDDVAVNPVPEPSTLILAAIGLLSLLGFSCRQQQRAE